MGNIGWGREEVAQAAAASMTNNSYISPPFITEDREIPVSRLRDNWLLDLHF